MKKFLVTMIAILLIAVLGIGGYFIWKLNEKLNEQNNQISTIANDVNEIKSKNTNSTNNAVITNTTNTTNTTNNTTKTNEEIIKEAYLSKIKQSYPNCTDYRIDNVRVYSEAEKKSLIDTLGDDSYKTTDILAIVEYSIKPQDIKTYVIAGNGEVQGDWVVGKSACVTYRDGKIVADGTGW